MEKPTLEVFALRYEKDLESAEELVQDTIIRALQDSSSYQADRNLKAWLYGLMKSVYLENHPEPLISLAALKRRKTLSLDDIKLETREFDVDCKEQLAKVNRNLKNVITHYSKDLRDFQKSSSLV